MRLKSLSLHKFSNLLHSVGMNFTGWADRSPHIPYQPSLFSLCSTHIAHVAYWIYDLVSYVTAFAPTIPYAWKAPYLFLSWPTNFIYLSWKAPYLFLYWPTNFIYLSRLISDSSSNFSPYRLSAFTLGFHILGFPLSKHLIICLRFVSTTRLWAPFVHV